MKSGLRLFYIFCVLFFAWTGGGPGLSLAQNDALVLPALQVTAGREEREEGRFANPVRVLEREDLDRIPGGRLEDILAREAGVVPRGGAGKAGGIDIRGMGDTFSSNVLILLDDVPMNPKDLSGVDFSAISLSDIERIEIHRGAGAVTWGDGAVGGVVRIFTRTGEEKKAAFDSEMGSFGYRKNRVRLSTGTGPVGLRLAAGEGEESGFRENGGFSSQDVGLDLFSREKEVWTFALSGHVYSDAYGLPGPVPQGGDVRKASTPWDGGETLEKRLSAQVEGDFASLGRLKLQRSLRYRNQSMEMTGRQDPLPAEVFPVVDIRSTEKTGRVDYHLRPLGKGLRIHTGLDHQESHYVRTDPDANLGQRHNGRMEGVGGFVRTDLDFREKLHVFLGGRLQKVTGDYREDRFHAGGWRQRELRNRSWNMQAWDAGLSLDLYSWLTLYASSGTSFRSPNVDELARSSPELQPQEGRHWEVGLRSALPGILRFELGFFSMEMTEEIHYDTHLQENRNYEDKTRRQGLETALSLYPGPDWSLRMDLTWMQARFAGKDTVIPLVPEVHGGVQVAWDPLEDLGVYLAGRWFGKRYDGNDGDNREKPLDPYQVWDLRFRLKQKPLAFFLEVNNLWDASYALAAYSGSVYPMPGRNLKVGVEVFF
ncbi:TonB-dependent receptor [Desulfobotulus sp.]|uniref:TonB-dependent receptor n=1 Tax=Desulfobotulus sp. TaxID=1940337 RepID=UPI002A368A00|nr:TonB-dependent receptor [Desulfobotulus sp.]MDY0162996.1 TonB-dependent receptor [Desulfobotulus sp.]